MDRAAEFMNSLIIPTPLRGAIRNFIIYRRSGYQEIGSEPETSCWIKLIIYLGSAVALILSIVAFAYGYIIIPAISTSTVVLCAALFWFRNSAVWGRLLECSRTVCCFPCNYFKRPISPEAEIRYERRLRQLLFGRSVEVKTDGEEQSEAQTPALEASSGSESSVTIDTKPAKRKNENERRLRPLLFERSVEVKTEGAEKQSEAPTPASEASSESESSMTIDPKPVKRENVTEN